jgi:hypothetical protein
MPGAFQQVDSQEALSDGKRPVRTAGMSMSECMAAHDAVKLVAVFFVCELRGYRAD